MSLAQFGILFAVLCALGAVAHADSTREACGKVGKVVATETTYDYSSAPKLQATVEIDGKTFSVKPEIAQLVLAAKAAGQRVCAVEKFTEGALVEQGYGASKNVVSITIEDQVHP
jgi:hypothetical protein